MKKKFYIFLLTCAGITLYQLPSMCAGSILASLMQSSKAVVQVHARAAGLSSSPTKSFIDKKTGQLIQQQSLRSIVQENKGGGIIIDPSGIVATNLHTIRNARQILIVMRNGDQFGAELLHVAPEKDLALLRIRGKTDYPYLRFADSDKSKIRHKVYSVGSSNYLENTISEGSITGKGRTGKKDRSKSVDLLTLSFKVYPGDSGSPIFDEKGDLLGITIAGKAKGRGFTVALASNEIVEELKAYEAKEIAANA